MVKNNKDIDVLFREKLDGHSEKPTPMAWEKIQERLDQKRKRGIPHWMRIAATVLMAGLGLTFIYSLISPTNNSEMIVQKQFVPDTKPGKIPALEVLPKRFQEENITSSKPTTIADQEPVKNPKPATGKPTHNLDLIAEEVSEVASKETIPMMEVEGLDLPPLDIDLLVADGGISVEEEEVAYKVTIISNGLSPRKDKDNLVDEIENKIGQLGGLLNKVDREFAELQDTKNNLFASLTSRKDNSN
jgi:hypothetical protein